MKREITGYVCDYCGREYDGLQNGWYSISDHDEYSSIGVKAMFSNGGVGSKYDLCPKCTVEIVEQWLKRMKEEAE